jgi:PEP-CTERM motif
MENRVKKFGMLALAAILGAIGTQAAQAGQTAVYLHAQPGSWVGGSLPQPITVFTEGITGSFRASQNYAQGVSISYDGFPPPGSYFGDWYYFDFSGARNNPQPLHTGLYQNAVRFPFNDTQPGLSFSGNGRGNNTLGGWFNVLEIAYGQNGGIDRFAVDFRQFDESESQRGPSTYGSLRYNSDIPIAAVPEPETYAMMGLGLAALAFVARRRRQA